MALIDTHSIVEDLIAAGFAKSQAEALTKLKILHYEDLASKKDLENVETSLKKDLENVGKSVKSELSTLKWMVGVVCALMIMLLSFQLGKL